MLEVFNGFAIVFLCILAFIAVALFVPITWVRWVAIGIVVVLVVGVVVWIQTHKMDFLKRRIIALVKDRGQECVMHEGDFFVVLDGVRKYKIIFSSNGLKMKNILIQSRMTIPYYERMEKELRCILVDAANEKFPYVKIVDNEVCIKCMYNCAVEYASDFWWVFCQAVGQIDEQAMYMHSTVMSIAENNGWVKRDAEGNVIEEEDVLDRIKREQDQKSKSGRDDAER